VLAKSPVTRVTTPPALLGKLLLNVTCYSYKLLLKKSNLLQLLVTVFQK